MQLVKRILCILLILALNCPLMSFAAEEQENNEQNKEYVKSINLLTSLGILQGNTAAKYADNVTGLEFAKVIASIIYPGWDSGKPDSQASDSPDEENAALKNILTSAKILTGNGEGNLSFEKDVTYHEAVKALVSMAGYGEIAKNSGGYPVGYLQMALNTGILKGFKENSQQALNWGETAKLVLNTLEADTAEISSYSINNGAFQIEKKGNMLGTIFSTYKSDGVVMATEDTNLYGSDELQEGYILIEDTKYKTLDKASKNFLGHKVDFYYRYLDGDDYGTLLYIQDTRDVSVLNINSEDIYGFTNNKYTYLLKGESKEKTAKLKASPLVLYNNKAPTRLSGNSLYVPQNGRVTLIDNDSDSTYDIVFIWAYQTIVVGAVGGTSGCIITDYYTDEQLELDPSSDSYQYKVIKGENEVTTKEIAKWNVLSVAKSDSAYGDILYTVVVSDTMLTGVVEDYSEDKITIDGVDFTLCSVFDKPQKVGEKLDFYLDFMGHVAVYNPLSTDKRVHYGMLVKVGNNRSAIGKRPIFKVYTDDGEMQYFQATEKIDFDGIRIKSSDLLKSTNKIYDMATSDAIRQLIGFKTNDNGEITFIDTDQKNPQEDEDSLTSTPYKGGVGDAQKYQFLLWGRTISVDGNLELYALPDQLPQFVVPCLDPTAGVIASDTKYDNIYSYKKKVSYGDGHHINAKFYNVNDALVPELLVEYASVTVGDGDNKRPMLLVDSVSKMIDENGETINVINGWQKTAEKIKLRLADADQIDPNSPALDDIKHGDIIVYEKRAVDDKVVKMLRWYRDGETQYSFTDKDCEGVRRGLYGKVAAYDYDNAAFTVKYDQTLIPCNIKGPSDTATFMVYNRTTGRVRPASAGDLKKGQDVFIHKRITITWFVVIFED